MNIHVLKYQTFLKLGLLAILFLHFASCRTKKNNGNAKNETLYLSDLRALDSLNTPLSDPEPWEWLYSHKETGQTFTEYTRSKPVYPTSGQNKIYIKPVGEFDRTDSLIIKTLREYMQTFFGLETILLEHVSDSVIPDQSGRIYDGTEQLHTRYILDKVLIKSFPEDAIVYIALTSKDLYPSDDWNFVFGQASLRKRVGVSSLYRFKNENTETAGYTTYLKRIMKTITHETGHMFSLKHCIRYKCLMNGSNSLYEADHKPSWLCPDCLAKILWCTNYDIYDRYDSLISFCKKYNFIEEEEYYKKSKTILQNQ